MERIIKIKIRTGDKVWFSTWDDQHLPAIITGFGENKGCPVADLTIEGATEWDRSRWAYLDQLTRRD